MEIKVYPFFIGRLGNNLFQIAACIGYAKKYGVGWGITKGYIETGFKVNQVDRFFPHLPSANGAAFRRWNAVDYFYYKEIPKQPNGVCLIGWFQSEKYFANAKEEIRKAFKVPIVPGYEDFVSVHVRRGDYVENSGSFPPITSDYIDQAIIQMKKLGITVKKLLFFSDEIGWCKDNFPSLGKITCYYSEGRNEFEDLSLMSSCGHHIISNSTLAWWGAWLGENPDKIVVAPHNQNWFGPNNEHKNFCYDLLPENWIQIKFRD